VTWRRLEGLVQPVTTTEKSIKNNNSETVTQMHMQCVTEPSTSATMVRDVRRPIRDVNVAEAVWPTDHPPGCLWHFLYWMTPGDIVLTDAVDCGLLMFNSILSTNTLHHVIKENVKFTTLH